MAQPEVNLTSIDAKLNYLLQQISDLKSFIVPKREQTLKSQKAVEDVLLKLSTQSKKNRILHLLKSKK